MARRRSTARRRPRRRKKGNVWVPWLFGALAAIIVVPYVLDAVRAHWPWLLGLTALLAAGAVGVIVVRRRMITADRDRWIAVHGRLGQIDRMTGPEFEHLVAELMRRDGFSDVRRVGGGGDLGIDVTGVAPSGRLFAVQCKRWSRSVGSPAVRNVVGAVANTYRGHQGVVVASCRFTPPAWAEGTSGGLVMIDRDRLAEWLTGACSLPGARSRPRLLDRLPGRPAARQAVHPPPVVREDGPGFDGVAAD
ncbi:restriction endonuclease [Streptosporangium roseum]|uniref:restriction endonuclease n=1 Tax=Streptosporangium roseum TaxID=2001 RepID=UPI00332DB348